MEIDKTDNYWLIRGHLMARSISRSSCFPSLLNSSRYFFSSSWAARRASSCSARRRSASAARSSLVRNFGLAFSASSALNKQHDFMQIMVLAINKNILQTVWLDDEGEKDLFVNKIQGA